MADVQHLYMSRFSPPLGFLLSCKSTSTPKTKTRI